MSTRLLFLQSELYVLLIWWPYHGPVSQNEPYTIVFKFFQLFVWDST